MIMRTAPLSGTGVSVSGPGRQQTGEPHKFDLFLAGRVCPWPRAGIARIEGGVFVIDSKQWTGSVHQSADGLAWHHHSPP
jgi:hypothetical protein